MSIHYGAARMAAHWNGNDPERVKAYWANKLASMPSEGIAYALKNLPSNPPTVDEFIAAANRRPRPPFKAIEYKNTTPREIGREKMRELRARFFPRSA